MRITLCITMLFWGISFCFAQNYTTAETASSRVVKIWERARHYSAAEHFDDALEELDKIFKIDDTFIDGYIRYGAIRYTQGNFAEAIPYYQRALALDEKYDPDVLYQLALAFYNSNQFAESTRWFTKFIDSDSSRERLKKRAEKYLANAKFAAEAIENPVPFRPEPVSPAINTEEPEYFPSLTADGQALVYTRRTRNQEDLYISRKRDGEWQPGVPIPGVNTDLNEGTQQISADGRFLVFTACNRREGMGDCDIYFSEYRNHAWTRPANIRPPVNTGAWESQPSVSANGQILYFASNREGGFGGSDIWMSERQADGTWGKPQNLGDQINTPEDDQSPFIHPDGRTLYFMSKGHPGMGGSDLFMTKLNPDGTWSKPQNLGYPINTKADESALIVNLDGTQAYFSMVEAAKETNLPFPTRADVNIYTFELPAQLRPDPVTYVQAQVVDATTREPLEAQIDFTDLQSGRLYAAATTDKDGTFLVCLPLGSDYALNVGKEKYLFYSENFALAEQSSREAPYLLEIALIPVSENTVSEAPVRNQPVVLRNVFFETGSAALLPASVIELNRLKKLLEDNPDLVIRINGHTDNVGPAEDNLQLSERRAQAVYDFLTENGIAEERLSYMGFGESQPIDTNETPEGRQRNRRTEFEVR